MALPDFEENHSLGERVVVVDVAREGAESILRDSGQEAGGGSGEGEDKGLRRARVRRKADVLGSSHKLGGSGITLRAADVTLLPSSEAVTASVRFRFLPFLIRTLCLPSGLLFHELTYHLRTSLHTALQPCCWVLEDTQEFIK